MEKLWITVEDRAFSVVTQFLFLKYKTNKLSKMIEYASALWTIAMYLTLGGGPMISKLLFN